MRRVAPTSPIRTFVWRHVARFLARPATIAWLKRRALQHPFDHLPGYMDRWWLIAYQRGFPFAVRLHHIQREDVDRHLHDHPWNWRTVILTGWYDEEDVFGIVRRRNPGDTQYRTAETFHRVAAISPETELWTLFITYRWRNRWGFLVGDPARKVYYREYHPTVPRHGERNP